LPPPPPPPGFAAAAPAIAKAATPAARMSLVMQDLLPNGENGPFAAPFHRLNGWNLRFSALG
jgi:hypothetical protein